MTESAELGRELAATAASRAVASGRSRRRSRAGLRAPLLRSFALAFDGESAPFASVGRANGTLAVTEGPAMRGAFLEHAANGVRLHGFVAARTLRLYTKPPVALGGWLVPQATTADRPRAPTRLRPRRGSSSS